MNINEYISSGIIESYILGLATDLEREEFESICNQYPQIKQAKEQFELSLENKFLNEAIPPPAFLKEKIQASLDIPSNNKSHEKHASVLKLKYWKFAAAASILLLAGSLIWGISQLNHYEIAKQTNQQLRNDLNQTQQSNPFLALKPIVKKPTIKLSALMNKENPNYCMAHIYWDTLSKVTYLLIGNMPQAPSDKQYQLWALINKNTIDLGVFDIKKEGLLVKMKNAYNAEAFAITIEPKGGSATPTTEAMVALGNL